VLSEQERISQLVRERNALQEEMVELERVQGDFVDQYGIQDHEISNELLDLQEEIAQIDAELKLNLEIFRGESWAGDDGQGEGGRGGGDEDLLSLRRSESNALVHFAKFLNEMPLKEFKTLADVNGVSIVCGSSASRLAGMAAQEEEEEESSGIAHLRPRDEVVLDLLDILKCQSQGLELPGAGECVCCLFVLDSVTSIQLFYWYSIL
jgi:hypothetical protein